MKNKFSGFIASGQTHSKISLGDIFKDSYGYRVKIISVDDRRVSYLRDGYDFECVMPRQQFERDFILVKIARQIIRGVPQAISVKFGQC